MGDMFLSACLWEQGSPCQAEEGTQSRCKRLAWREQS